MNVARQHCRQPSRNARGHDDVVAVDESVIARPNRSPLNTMMHGQQLDVGGDFADTATLQQRAELGANVATGVGESTDSYPKVRALRKM